MKTAQTPKLLATTICAAALPGAVANSQTQAFLTDSHNNKFDIGSNTNDFSSSESVASRLYWYNSPGGSEPDLYAEKRCAIFIMHP